MTILRLLAFFVGAVLIVTFAVANRGQVVVEFFPLPFAPLQLPVYGVWLAGLVLGALLGAISMWLSALPLRAEQRRLRRQIQRMETQARQQRLRDEEAAAQRSLRRKERDEERDATALPLISTGSGPGASSD